MKKGQRPSKHIRRVKTRKGRRAKLINPSIKKRRKNYGSSARLSNDDLLNILKDAERRGDYYTVREAGRELNQRRKKNFGSSASAWTPHTPWSESDMRDVLFGKKPKKRKTDEVVMKDEEGRPLSFRKSEVKVRVRGLNEKQLAHRLEERAEEEQEFTSDLTKPEKEDEKEPRRKPVKLVKYGRPKESEIVPIPSPEEFKEEIDYTGTKKRIMDRWEVGKYEFKKPSLAKKWNWGK